MVVLLSAAALLLPRLYYNHVPTVKHAFTHSLAYLIRMSIGPGLDKVSLVDPTGAPIGVTGNPLVSSGGGGGGGTVTQGPAGSALQSWYMRDGSGLLATAALQTSGNASLTTIATNGATSALQTTGNATLTTISSKLTDVSTATLQTVGNGSLASIDSKLTDGTQLSKIYSDSGAIAVTVPGNSYVKPADASVVTTLSHANAATQAEANNYACSSTQQIFAADPNHKFRKVYNPSMNGFLCLRYGDSAVTGELDCTLMIKPGDSWTMPTIGGAPEFSGDVYAISTSAVREIIATYGYN